MMAEGIPTDHLPVKLGQEYRVKLGKSFIFPRENAYHTIKYDFKPLSVDTSKAGKLRVADDEVNVLLPLQAESTDDVAQFRGPKKPVTKECVLIIDTESGEAVLERISNTIQLKAIRDGRKSVNPRDRSPSPFLGQTKPAPTVKPQTALPSTAKKRAIKSKSKTPTPKPESNGSEPAKTSKKSTKKSVTVKKEPSPAFNVAPPTSTPSMPVFSSTDLNVSTDNSDGTVGQFEPPSKKIKVEFSSSSSSSSSSDSSDSESEAAPQNSQFVSSHMTGHMTRDSSMPQISSGHMTHDSGHMTEPVSHMTQEISKSQMSHMPHIGGHVTQGAGHMIPGGHVTQGAGHMIPGGHRPVQPKLSSSSSSSSDSSDSSSEDSSSSSSSESTDQEDREVASAFNPQQTMTQSKQPQPRKRTMSQLQTDLTLSESGSDSD